MVSIFVGSGSGFARGSGNIVGTAGLLGSGTQGRGGDNVSVNAATGNLLIAREDEFLVGRGPDLGISRTYNSLAQMSDGDNGDQWQQSTVRRVLGLTGTLNTTGSTISRQGGDGSVIVYTWNAALSAYTTTDGDGAHDKLVKSGSSWIWTDGSSQYTETYEASAGDPALFRIREHKDADGNKLSFAYLAGTDKLDRVTTANHDATGVAEQSYVQYSWSGNNITQIVTGYTDYGANPDPTVKTDDVNRTLTRTRYGYDGSNRLIKVTVDLSPEDGSIADGRTYVTEYTYDDASKRVATITQTDGSSLAITYDTSGRVATLTQAAATGDVRVTTLSYGASHTNITGPDGQVTRLDYAGGNIVPQSILEWNSVPAYIAKELADPIDGHVGGIFTSPAGATFSGVSASTAPVVAGDTLTYAISLQAVSGSATEQALGLYGQVSGWGTGNSSARILSGPGTLVQIGGGLWKVVGLSTTTPTRIEITRSYTQAENSAAYFYVDLPGNYRDGEQLIAAGAIVTKNSVIDGSFRQLTKITAPPAIAGATSQSVQFVYDSAGNLTNVVDSALKETIYTYDAMGNMLTSKDANNNVVARTYGAKNELLTETRTGSDASGASVSHTTRYVYDSENHLRFVISAEGRVVQYVYHASGQLYWQNEFPDSSYDLTGLTASQSPTLTQMETWRESVAGPTGTDRTGVQIRYSNFDSRGNIFMVRSYGASNSWGSASTADGYQITSYVYDQAGKLLSRQASGENRESLVYDGMGRIVAAADLAGGVTTYRFDDVNTTTIVHLSSGLTRTSVYNKAGDLVSETSSTPGYQPDEYYNDLASWSVVRASRASAAPIGGEAAYSYTVDTAGLHGYVTKSFSVAAGETATFRITVKGNPADVHRIGLYGNVETWGTIGATDASAVIVSGPGSIKNGGTYGGLFDLTGLSETQETVIELRRTYAQAQTSAHGTFYIGGTGASVPAGTSVTLAAANVTKTFTSPTEAISSATSYRYDALGRVRMITAPRGNATPGDAYDHNSFILYDRAGRKTADIAADGGVIEYRYDTAGRLAATVAYATALTASKMQALADAGGIAEIANYRPTTNAADQWNWSIFDDAGRLIQSIDALGAVFDFYYDTSDRLIRSVEYATKIAVTGFATTTPTARQTVGTSADDRIARSFYDGDGLLIGTLDGEGYLTELVYDEAGQKVDEIAYAAKTASAHWAAGSFTQLRASAAPTSAANRHMRYVYDARGLLRYTVDNAGYVSSFTYNYANKLTSTIVHAAPIGAADMAAGDFTYDKVKTVVAALAVDANDRESYTVYNAKGQIAYTIGAGGAVTGLAYDIAGNVTKTVQYAVARATVSLPALGTMDSWAAGQAANAANRVTRSWHDAAGQLRFAVDAEGYVKRFDRDADGRLAREIAWANRVVATDATTIAQIATLTNSAGSIVDNWYYYDAAGRITSVYDGEGYRTFNIWQANGLLQNVYHAYGTVDQSLTYYVYDGAGRMTSETRGYGTPEASTTSYQYTAFGEIKQATDANGKVTTYSYDDRGLRLTETNALSGVTRFAYNGFGELAKTTDPRTGVTYRYYDAQGRATYVVDAEKYVSRLYYNGFGEVAQSVRYATTFDATDTTTVANLEAAFGAATAAPPATAAAATYGYDKRGLKLTETDAAGTTTSTYNAFGNLLTVTRAGATTSFEYDNRGAVKRSIDAELFFESYGYDAFGNRTSVVAKSKDGTKTAGGTTTYAYDKRGLLVSETLPIASYNADGSPQAGGALVTNSYAYDGRGNRKQMIEAVGLAEARTTTYEYDRLDRLTKTKGQARTILDQNGHTAFTTSFVPEEAIAYDAAGNITRTTDAAGQSSVYFYDDLGRKIVEIDAAGTYTKHAYDANGNLTETRVYATKVAVPANGGGLPPTPPAAPNDKSRATVFTYDGLNRLRTSNISNVMTGSYSAGAWASATSPITTIHDYDAFGNVVKTIDPNTNAVWSYYDTAGRKTHQIDPLNYLTTWTYDAEGNVLVETRYSVPVTAPTSTSTPPALPTTDTAKRVTTFTYDKNGNRLSEERSGVLVHDESAPGTAVSVAAKVQWLYNGLGQVIRKTEATGDQTNYVYDAGGRLLTEMRASFADFEDTTPTTSPNATPTVHYRYNGLGDLSHTVAAGQGTTLARETRYTYDAGGLLATVTDAEGVVHEYSYDKRGTLIRDQYYRAGSAGGTGTLNAVLTKVDVLGRTIEQSVAAWSGTAWTKGDVATTEYNTFGEVWRSGINGGAVAEGNRLWQTENLYDGAGRLWGTNAGDGVWKFFGYDKNGNQTAAITSAGANIAWLRTENIGEAVDAAYRSFDDSNHNINAAYTQYDKRNQAVAAIETNRQRSVSSDAWIDIVSSRSYNAFGEVSSETAAHSASETANLAVTTYSYNNSGKMIRSEGPTVEITLENGTTFWVKPSQDYYYDRSGRLVATRDANGSYAGGGTSAGGSSKAANSGNLTRLTLLAGTGYGGSEALVTAESHADGGVKQTRYDIHGDARVLIDEVNRTTTQAFDRLGRMTQVSHAGGLVVSYAYDSLGQRTQHWNNLLGTSNKETTDYDVQGRVTATRAFGGDVTTTSYTWDATIAAAGMGVTTGGWSEVTRMSDSLANLNASIYKQSTEKTDLAGRVTWKSDLGGHISGFGYDAAGRQTSVTISPTSSGPFSSTSFTYYNTGLVKTNSGPNGTATYTYDAAGNRLTEQLKVGLADIKNQRATYDAMGRLKTWTEVGTATSPAASTTHSYDASGNIRRTQTSQARLNATGGVAATDTKDYWFAFDSMNRLTVDKGMLVGAVGGATTVIRARDEGTETSYNRAGERVTSRSKRMVWGYIGRPSHIPTEPGYLYYWEQRLGTSLETYTYDGAGRLTKVQEAASTIDGNTEDGITISEPVGPGKLRSELTYDLMGRLTLQKDYGGDEATGPSPFNGVSYSRTIAYNAKSQVTSDDTSTLRSRPSAGGSGYDTFRSVTTYSYGSGATYALGGVVTQAATNTKMLAGSGGSWTSDPSTLTTTTYAWFDGAVQDLITHDTNTGSGGSVYTTDLLLNGFGQLTGADVNDGVPMDVAYTLDEAGQIIRRDERRTGNIGEASPHEVFYRFAGHQMGMTGNNGTSDVNYTTSVLDRSKYRTDPTSSTAGLFRDGTKTGTIAYADFTQSYDPYNSYGQGSAGGSYTARSGDTLSSVAQAIYGDANLWYKLAEANGLGTNAALIEGQTLTLPVGVTRNTHNADTFKPYDPTDALGDLSPTTPKPPKKPKCGAFGQILVAAIAIGISIALPGGGTVIGAAINGAIGSAVSQAFGVATGIQDKFSLKGVALSALSAGVAVGVGDVLGKGAMFGSKVAGAAIRGAASSAITQGIAVATGLQSKFDFAGVAAAGIGAGIGEFAGQKLFNNKFTDNISGDLQRGVVGAASALTNAATRSAINGSSFGDNLIAALPDTIGQTLGSVAFRGAAALARAAGESAAARSSAGVAETSGNAAADEIVVTAQVNIRGLAGSYSFLSPEARIAVASINGLITPEQAQDANNQVRQFKRQLYQEKFGRVYVGEGTFDTTPGTKYTDGQVMSLDVFDPIDLGTLFARKQSYMAAYEAGNGVYSKRQHDDVIAAYDAREALIRGWDSQANGEINRFFGGFVAAGFAGAATLALGMPAAAYVATDTPQALIAYSLLDGAVAANTNAVLTTVNGYDYGLSDYGTDFAVTSVLSPFGRGVSGLIAPEVGPIARRPVSAFAAEGAAFEIAPASRSLILRPVEIEFPARGLSAAEQRLFSAHLAEQQTTLNRLSLFSPDDLALNLQNYQNVAPQVARARSLARGYLSGSGKGQDAAHALDSVAGGYVNEFAGFRDPVQQRIGALWRTRANQIVPGREHMLTPRFDK